MEDRILRRIFLAFIRVHILYHAKKEPFFGLWMIEELQHHGYNISAGTLYPILHKMEADNLLESKEKTFDGKIRKYYSITREGEKILEKAREKTKELFNEIIE
jgi:PadR family transcriptional regulator, regulatory protein PadR